MASTTKDSILEQASPEAAAGGGGAPNGALGAEIPVVVHASRYSAAPHSAGKRPAPVHEETQTVIVFPQGAVVRLSASLSTGELVVLTHRRTGADVICRVASVKTQPGIPSYVNLEFTQRAPGFWGDCFPAAQAPDFDPTSLPSASPVPSAVPPPEAFAPPQPAAPMPAAKPDPAVAGQAVTESPVAVPPPAERPAQGPAGIAASGPRGAPSAQPGRASGAQRPSQPFAPQFPGSETPSSSRKIFWGVAAVVLLAVVGTASAMLLHQNGRRAIDLSAASVPASGVPQPPASLSQPSPASELEEPATAPQAAEAATAPSVTKAAAKPAAPRRERIARHSAPVSRATRKAAPGLDVAKLSAPILKAHQAPDVSRPPVIAAAAGGPNVLASVQRDAAAPAPVRGGQIEQPRLIASRPPVYPPLARSESVQGVVVIEALVDASGSVAATKVLSGPGLLRNAAIAAVRGWRYRPARLDGQPIATHIQLHIRFRLQ